jgi:hypothetical protein
MVIQMTDLYNQCNQYMLIHKMKKRGHYAMQHALPPTSSLPSPAPKSTLRPLHRRGLFLIAAALIIAVALAVTACGNLVSHTDVTGQWSTDVTLSLGGLSGPGALDLQQDGSTVKGKLVFKSGTQLDLKGTINGKAIELTNDSGFADMMLDYKLSGTVTDDFSSMQGKVTVNGTQDLGDGSHPQTMDGPAGTWLATRS